MNGKTNAGAAPAREKQVFNWFAGLAFAAVRGALALLPARVAVAVGAVLGDAAFLSGIRRCVVLANLSAAFPQWDRARRRRVARRAYRNLGRMIAECLLFRSLPPEALDEMVDGIEGEENLDAVGGTGKPFVVVTAHVDNWELMGAYFVRRGFRLQVIAKPLHNPRVEAELTAMRRAVGLGILYTGEGMRPGIRHLKDGGVLAILGDQDARKQGLAVPFFGRPASTALGPAVFAWLARVPLVPVFAYRVGATQHRFRFYPPIHFKAGTDREKALEEMTRAHVAALESFVREHPENYFWFHRRWKTPPEKTASVRQ